VHSRRALAIHRSQIAFARGARTGVVMTRVPVAVKTASNASVYLASRSLIRNFKPSVRSPRSISVFRACCTVQAAVGWAVTPAQEDGVDVEEVDRGNCLGLGGQELVGAGTYTTRRYS